MGVESSAAPLPPGLSKRPRTEAPAGPKCGSSSVDIAELKCEETLDNGEGKTDTGMTEATAAVPPLEPLILPPKGSKDIQVRARWRGLSGVWRYFHVPAERNSMCPHALSKHERGCYCGVQWEGSYVWKFVPDHPPLSTNWRLTSEPKYAPGYTSLSRATEWDPDLVTTPSTKGWLALAKYLVLLSKAGPPDIENELAIALTGARWLVARHALLCKEWVEAGRAEVAEKGLGYPLQAPKGLSVAKEGKKEPSDMKAEGVYSIFTMPTSDLVPPDLTRLVDQGGAKLLPAEGIMAPGEGVMKRSREGRLALSDEASEMSVDSSEGGFQGEESEVPCGPGDKGALVEMSNPITEDRKGYLPKVVEGHQRQSPAPSVTAKTVSSGSGGGDASADKL